MTTEDIDTSEDDAREIMIQLEFAMDDFDKAQTEIKALRVSLAAKMMIEGIQEVKGYERFASFRNNTASRSFKYDKLLKDDSDQYDRLLADGYIKYTEPKSPQSLVIKKVD